MERLKKLDLGSPSRELRPMNHNAHLHVPPNFSAFLSLEAMVDAAVAEGVKVLGLSNYYYHEHYPRFVEMCLDRRIFPLVGLEVIAQDVLMDEGDGDRRLYNDPSNPGRVYLCGLGCSYLLNPAAKDLEVLRRIRQGDQQRMEMMASVLNQRIVDQTSLDLTIDYTVLLEALAKSCGATDCSLMVPQERHLALAIDNALRGLGEDNYRDALGELLDTYLGTEVSLDPVATQGMIRSSLLKAGRPCYVEEKFIELNEAIDLILSLGGVPCYPMLLDGVGNGKPFTQFEQDEERMLNDLYTLSIPMIQAIPGRNESGVVEGYCQAAREFGMFITLGTEHNTMVPQSLIPACKGGVPLSPQLNLLGWQGVCVAACRQIAGLQGYHELPILVTAEGFARVGDSIIHQVVD